MEVFDLFLTCVGSEDLKDDKATLGFLGMNSIRMQRTCFNKTMTTTKLDETKENSKISLATTRKGPKEQAKTAKLKKWIEKKKAYMRHQQQEEATMKVWNILEESIHRRTTATLSSLRSKASIKLDETYPLPPREPRTPPNKGCINDVMTSLDRKAATPINPIQEEITTTDSDETRDNDADVNHRDDVDTSAYGTTTTARTLAETSMGRIGAGNDPGDDRRREVAYRLDHHNENKGRDLHDEPFELIQTPELVKPSTIAKLNKKTSPVQHPTGQFESFKKIQLDSHRDSTIAQIPETKIVTSSAKKTAASSWERRAEHHQEVRQMYQQRLDILARSAAVRAAAAASRRDE
jgi:hypothetical protein